MGDRQPVTVKFEVLNEKQLKSKIQPKLLEGETRVAVKKTVKFLVDDVDPATSRRNSADNKNSTASTTGQPLEGEKEKTKIRSRFVIPQMARLSVVQQSQNGLTPRNPRRCLSASNRSLGRSSDTDQGNWIFPSSKSMDRDLTLIDLDLKVSENKQYEIKEQMPPSLLPKKRDDSRPDTLNNRPRSSSLGTRTILKKVFPMKNSINSNNSTFNLHANQWTHESRIPDAEEHLSRPGLEPGRRSQEAFRQNYRRAVTPHLGYGKVIIGSKSPTLHSEDSRESKSSNWGVPVTRNGKNSLPINHINQLQGSSDKWSRDMNSNQLLPRNSLEYFSLEKHSYHTHTSGF